MIRIRHLIRPRQFGKTWDCMDRSAETGAVIVVRDAHTREFIIKIAKERNLNIPKPVIASQLVKDHSIVPKGTKLIIDDADMILIGLLGREIDTISMVQRDANGIETMSNIQKRMMFGNSKIDSEECNNGKE